MRQAGRLSSRDLVVDPRSGDVKRLGQLALHAILAIRSSKIHQTRVPQRQQPVSFRIGRPRISGAQATRTPISLHSESEIFPARNSNALAFEPTGR
jgi:hypothetical protein